MGRFGAAVTAVVELVALAEPLGLAPLVALTSPEAVEEAEARGLVQIVADERRTNVRLAHPLYGVGDALRQHGDSVLAGICQIEYAHVLAMCDAAPAARAAFEAGAAHFTRLRALQDSWRYLTEPWAIAVSGELGNAVEFALGTATVARQLGAVAFETMALHTAVRLGHAELAADRLAELVQAQDGDLAALLASHARAAACADGAALEEAASGFLRIGWLPCAAEASAQAAQAWENAGRRAFSRAAASRAWMLAARCQGLRTPALARLASPGLTRREEEIARMASAGSTSKQIAERLVLSVRTVNNHLQSAYAKLGVSDRSSLKRVLTIDHASAPTEINSTGRR
ncbi:hypothetical protein Acor_57330 [Acrocarpospora corrugata]|uniref:HTH luxR-type domain-containing protein n=1 Tax=Acrocarpospora corrugata TaxID=35763 RepID=A0A5M3W3N3_9ACTN|nr:helix-turn-helix transcriptional regulator [Acrocarpospora corrugata]GES03667.1 hypothetical protein Acor_57330 [Acrocarpospora corrugata]